MKSLILAAATVLSANAKADQFEICIPTGECALMVQAKEVKGSVYLVRLESEYLKFSSLWEGAWFVAATPSEYQAVKQDLSLETIILPGVNPNDSWRLEAGRPAPKPSGGGPLVSGTVTVGNITIGGGGAQCTDCHTGSWKDIHAGKLKKPDEKK